MVNTVEKLPESEDPFSPTCQLQMASAGDIVLEKNKVDARYVNTRSVK